MARRRGRDGRFALCGRIVQGRVGAREGACEGVCMEDAGHFVTMATDERERESSVSAAMAHKLRAQRRCQRSIAGLGIHFLSFDYNIINY